MAKKNNLLIFCIVCAFTFPLFGQQEKCGTFHQIRRLWDARQFRIASPISVRPVFHRSILTENGKIRIHFDTSGTNEPAMVDGSGNRIPNSFNQYIDTLRSILDSVWNAEIDAYGFTAPPADAGRGGGNEYDFYVQELGGGLFGQTDIEDDLPLGTGKVNERFPTFIRIDNDFGVGYRTRGVPAIMATAAHEFHHAIQVGGSGIWEDEHFYFYELSAEAMENTVFRDARDYIFDVKTYFSNISNIPLFALRSQTSYQGYERAIWGMFLIKKFSVSVMKKIWDEMKEHRPAIACEKALNSFSSSIEREFVDFVQWNFYTAHRADAERYYADAGLLSPVALYMTATVPSWTLGTSVTTKNFAPHYIKAVNGSDSAFFIISATDLDDAEQGSGKTYSSEIRLTSNSASGYPAVTNSIYAEFSAANLTDWSYVVVGTNVSTSCFPNPYNPALSSLLIPLNGIGASPNVTMTILSAATLDLIYTGVVRFKSFSGTQYAEWIGRDNNGNIVPSGVYVYVLSLGSTIVKGKFSVIR